MQLYSLAKSFLSLMFLWLLACGALYFYIDYSDNWTILGHGRELFKDNILWQELALVVLIISGFHFSSIKNKACRFLLPIIPVIIAYLLFDGFYHNLSRSPYPSDFQNFNSLMAFSPLVAVGLSLTFVSIPVILILLMTLGYKATANKLRNKKTLLWQMSGRFAYLLLLGGIINSQFMRDYQEENFDYIVWSQEDTIRDNGRFNSFIYFHHQEKLNATKLANLIAQNSTKNKNNIDNKKNETALFSGAITQPRNIHLIVLESFIDPRKLKDIKFSHNILADELLPYLNEGQKFSLVNSPIYGGGTAQAEFELLTGVPALAKVNRIEFNVMKGAPMSSFVKRLKENDYLTQATIATGSGFFNSRQAYQSLGFEQVEYLEESAKFQALLDYGPIFDGDLLTYNLQQLKQQLATSDKPLFNYVLGMYGHLPFARNLDARPDIAEVEHPDDRVKRISNQFYYRTQAIAQYIESLKALDKNSIIYITSDHLPSILGEETIYQLDNKLNIALYFEQGTNRDVSGKNYYHLPWLIWDTITLENERKQLTKPQLEALYYKGLSESIGGS